MDDDGISKANRTTCHKCGKVLAKNSLSYHLLRVNCEDRRLNKNKYAACKLCERSYGTVKSLMKHYREKHGVLSKVPTKSHVCGHCDFSCFSVAELCEHVKANPDHWDENRSAHGYEFCTVELANEDEFAKWKAQIEKESNEEFVKKCGDKQTSDFLNSRFYCRRSGKSKRRDPAHLVRAPSRNGTPKVGYSCTAHIEKRTLLADGSIIVTCCLDHYGHGDSTPFLHLPKETRFELMELLRNNVPHEEIIKDAKAKHKPGTREFLLTRRDLKNLEMSPTLQLEWKRERDEQDLISVDALIKDSRQVEADGSPYFIYEPQGIQCEDGTTGFILGYQDEYMLELFVKRCNQWILVDTTPYVSIYNLILIVLLVADHNGEGIPAAFLLTKTHNTTVVAYFLQELVKRCQTRDCWFRLRTKELMTESSQTFSDAWCDVGADGTDETVFLFSQWHCKLVWRQQIRTLNKSFRRKVHEGLENICVESNEASCMELYNSLTEFVQREGGESGKDFVRYLDDCWMKVSENERRNGVSRFSRWAGFGRAGSLVDVSKADWFGEILKKDQLGSKSTLRLDALIECLGRAALSVRDSAFRSYDVQQPLKGAEANCDVNGAEEEEMLAAHAKWTLETLLDRLNSAHLTTDELQRIVEFGQQLAPLEEATVVEEGDVLPSSSCPTEGFVQCPEESKQQDDYNMAETELTSRGRKVRWCSIPGEEFQASDL